MKSNNNTIGSEYLLLSGVHIAHFSKISKYRPYYAGIMLDAFGNLLCFKLCRHNRLVPITYCLVHQSYIMYCM